MEERYKTVVLFKITKSGADLLSKQRVQTEKVSGLRPCLLFGEDGKIPNEQKGSF